MLIDFFTTLKRHQVPVSLRELLDLLNAMDHRLVYGDINDFYFLSRALMVKDESHYDRFDVAFGKYFKGLDHLDGLIGSLIPDDWLRKQFEESLSTLGLILAVVHGRRGPLRVKGLDDGTAGGCEGTIS